MTRFLVGISLVGLLACSGGGSSSDGGLEQPEGGAPVHDSAPPLSQSGGCGATAMPTLVVASYPGFSLSVVGQDAYYINPIANGGRGALHHVLLDGTGDSVILDPSPGSTLAGATAVGTDIFYFQEDDPLESAIHLYRTSRANGGPGTQVGKGAFPGFGVSIIGGGYAGIIAGQSAGVFAQNGTDIFVCDQQEISRVSTQTGEKTVIATLDGQGGIKWPALVGPTIYFRDGIGKIYSAPANTTTPSGVLVGTQTCGMGNTQWMASYSGGFFCGASFGLDKIDITGTNKSHVIYTLTDKDVLQFNPTAIDGTTFYALPVQSAKDGAIYRVDATTGAKTAISCAVRAVVDSKLTPTDIVFVELRGEGANAALSLKRLARPI